MVIAKMQLHKNYISSIEVDMFERVKNNARKALANTLFGISYGVLAIVSLPINFVKNVLLIASMPFVEREGLRQKIRKKQGETFKSIFPSFSNESMTVKRILSTVKLPIKIATVFTMPFTTSFDESTSFASSVANSIYNWVAPAVEVKKEEVTVEDVPYKDNSLLLNKEPEEPRQSKHILLLKDITDLQEEKKNRYYPPFGVFGLTTGGNNTIFKLRS